MQPEIDIERGSELHEKVKEYSQEQRVRHSRAYAELIEQAIEDWEEGE